MLPCCSRNDAADRLMACPELACQLILGNMPLSMFGSDCQNLVIGESRKMGLAATLRMALLHHVGHVVGVRTKEQMIRVNAERVIAARAVVAHLKIIRERPVSEFPRQPVGKYVFPSLDLCIDDTVSIVVDTTDPQPTAVFVGKADVLPESTFDWLSDPLVSTRVPAKNPVIRRSRLEGAAARSTDSRRVTPTHDMTFPKKVVRGQGGGCISTRSPASILANQAKLANERHGEP